MNNDSDSLTPIRISSKRKKEKSDVLKSDILATIKPCPNMAILDAELSDNEEENDAKLEINKNKRKVCSKRILHSVKWGEKTLTKHKGNECYSMAVVGDLTVKLGDFVTLKSENPNEPLCIAKIIYMYDKAPQKFIFHGHLFCRGSDTILGETADPRELFLVDSCEDLPLGAIVHKAEVEFRKTPDNWFNLGGEVGLQEPLEDDGKTFFYAKRLEENRFVDIELDFEKFNNCVSCKDTAFFRADHRSLKLATRSMYKCINKCIELGGDVLENLL